MAKTDSPLLTEREAAEYLGISPHTLRRQRCDGIRPGGIPLVPYRKLGRNIRYHIADLTRFVDTCKVGEAIDCGAE